MDKSNQIKFIKAKLALLDAEKEQLLRKLKYIEKGMPFPSKTTPVISINSSTSLSALDNISESSQEQQIKLFRNLFRGRDDVFARLWVSRKTGKSGYSPVCKNEWVTKICQKPIMKCSKCPNRELLPLDDEIICKHLAGRHVVGIYPMLQDETCYFLVVDFDGDDWIDNISVLRETCLEEGVPIAIERSRFR
jgi:hypothetical protein